MLFGIASLAIVNLLRSCSSSNYMYMCRAGHEMWGNSLSEYQAIDTSEHMGKLARVLRNGMRLTVVVLSRMSVCSS